jgi:hypothetical protein
MWHQVERTSDEQKENAERKRDSRERTVASSLPDERRNALVHRTLRGLRFSLKLRWHLERQNMKLCQGNNCATVPDKQSEMVSKAGAYYQYQEFGKGNLPCSHCEQTERRDRDTRWPSRNSTFRDAVRVEGMIRSR